MSQDIEFHILELPKFTKTIEELESGLDAWLYFLRNGEMMETGALPAALREPSIVRAVEELTMLTQTEIERERYEARLKAQLDQDSFEVYWKRRLEQGLKEGLQKGRDEGRKVGEQIGAIHAFERVLRRAETPEEQLRTQSLDALTQLAADLEKQAIGQR
jgi:predicted transposase/invertase (TIGR01784 family)